MLDGREWYKNKGASSQLLARLRSLAPETLPESYFNFLAYSDGGEGPLEIPPFNLRLDNTATVIEGILKGYPPPGTFDGFLIFGGDGGGEYLAFDLRGKSPWPIVSIDMVVGAESAQVVALDFDALLEKVGVSGSPR